MSRASEANYPTALPSDNPLAIVLKKAGGMESGRNWRRGLYRPLRTPPHRQAADDAGLAETRADGARFESKVDARFAEVKADAARLESKVDAGLAEVKAEIAEVKADVAEVKAGLAEVKTDVARLDGKIESEVGRLETRLTVRMYSGLIATAAVVVALIKLLP